MNPPTHLRSHTLAVIYQLVCSRRADCEYSPHFPRWRKSEMFALYCLSKTADIFLSSTEVPSFAEWRRPRCR